MRAQGVVVVLLVALLGAIVSAAAARGLALQIPEHVRESFGAGLEKKPMLVAATKTDVVNQDKLAKLRERLLTLGQ